MDFDQRCYYYFVRTPFVIDESCKEVQQLSRCPRSITVAVLARLTETFASDNYSDSIIANKEIIADYQLDLFRLAIWLINVLSAWWRP